MLRISLLILSVVATLNGMLGQENSNKTEFSRFSFRVTPTYSIWMYNRDINRISHLELNNDTKIQSTHNCCGDNFTRNGGGVNSSLMLRLVDKISIGVSFEFEIFNIYFNRGNFFEFPDVNLLYGGLFEYQVDENLIFQLTAGYEFLAADTLEGWRPGAAVIFLFPQKKSRKVRVGLRLGYGFKRLKEVRKTNPRTYVDFFTKQQQTTYTEYKSKVSSHFFKIGLFILIKSRKKHKI